MSKEEIEKRFQEEIEWLKKTIPENQIYELYHQLFKSSEYLLHLYSEWVDVYEEVDKDKALTRIIFNICSMANSMRKESCEDNS